MCLKYVSEQCDFKSGLKFYTTCLWKKKKSSVNEIPTSVNANFEIALNLKSPGRK